MMRGFSIEDLSLHADLIPLLVRLHFEEWGDLTGAASEADYAALLDRHASGLKLPQTLVAVCDNDLIGSVNITACDMAIRHELTPWIAQLHVLPEKRGHGVGAALVRGALARCRDLGFQNVYLYTSGTLPAFYERIGWTRRENVLYKNKERTIMEINISC